MRMYFLFQSLNNIPESIQFYRRVLKLDNTNIEAISCIAAHHFYEDQPEISLKFYRRLLQMGVMNASILNNVALCCFHAQQFDMIIGCFLKSLVIVRTDEERAEIWYNIGEMALVRLFIWSLNSEKIELNTYFRISVYCRNEISNSMFSLGSSF